MTRPVRHTAHEMRNAAEIAQRLGVRVTLEDDGAILFSPSWSRSEGGQVPIEKDDPPQYVYFMECQRTRLIKIGISFAPYHRRNQLSYSWIYPIKIIHIERGWRNEEREYHQRFADYRETGEWFRNEGDLAAFLQTLERNTEIEK